MAFAPAFCCTELPEGTSPPEAFKTGAMALLFFEHTRGCNMHTHTQRELEREADRILGAHWLRRQTPKREILLNQDACVPIHQHKVRRQLIQSTPEEDGFPEITPSPIGSIPVQGKKSRVDPKPHVLQATVKRVLELLKLGTTEALLASAFRLRRLLRESEVVECIGLLGDEIVARRDTRAKRQPLEDEINYLVNSSSRGPHYSDDLRDARFQLMTFDERCENESRERFRLIEGLLASLLMPSRRPVSADPQRIAFHAVKKPVIEVIHRQRR